MTHDDVTLRAHHGPSSVEVTVVPTAGGRLRQITITTDAGTAELLAPSDDVRPNSTGWGSFPMAPWAGRVRHGRFHFVDEAVRLDLDHSDGGASGGGPIDPPAPSPDVADQADRRHAIHGTVYFRPWTVVDATDTTIEMTCPIDGARNWPYRGVARQLVSLHHDRLELELIVELHDRPAPISIGWHPWFTKPDRLDFSPVAMYRRDAIGLPTGELVAPAPPPWDDCFVNRSPVTLHYDRDVAPTITVSSPDCDHWVVFDGTEHATCVEPQSGPPDAPNVRPEIVTPTHPLRRTMTIRW
jgi:aldose 1-epimerase